MDFTNEQKLIVALLTEVHAALNIKNGMDPIFIQSMISGGHSWAISWKYHNHFPNQNAPSSVLFVADVLDLWEKIELSVAAFTQGDRATLLQLAPVFGKNVTFRGFDANNEESYGIAGVFVDDLGLFSHFKGRNLNSHSASEDGYRHMLDKAKSLNTSAFATKFTVQELAAILNATAG